ncbi:hypothetical protein [Allokutzneria albata]|uniref:Uncharacterized protein n=1 Tax=Allokutzneria albata TaxID=211114 RepID=A0A1G9VTH1_ALLAB|nr:hypothetical protein [Allokutzneria albata]SDM75562.1 hypothetical protein SAMN04489726_3230 [Allokutzneria albata]
MNSGPAVTRWLPPLTAALALIAYALHRNIPRAQDLSQPSPTRRDDLGWALLNFGVFDVVDDNRVFPLQWEVLTLAVLVFAVAAGCHWWRTREIPWLWAPVFLAFLLVLTAVKSLSFNNIALAMSAVVVGTLLVCAGLALFRRDRLWGLAGVFGASLVITLLRPVDGFLVVLFAVVLAYAVMQRGAVLALTAVAYLVVVWWPQWTVDQSAGLQILSGDSLGDLDWFWLSARVYLGPVLVLLLGAIAAALSANRGGPEEPGPPRDVTA